ncbi:STE/STE7/MEK1 protein kinase, partial [Thecamonas trahens ATCC 50062]
MSEEEKESGAGGRTRVRVKTKTRRRKPKVVISKQQDFSVTPTGTYVDKVHKVAISRKGVQFTDAGGQDGANVAESGTASASRSTGEAQAQVEMMSFGADEGGDGPGAGMTLGDLEVVGEAGSGGCGTVFKVIDKRTAEVYAMKTVRLEVADKVRAQIMRELRTLDTCRSAPGVVDFVAAFFADGEINMVMEYMDEGSLLDVYRAIGPLPEPFIGAVAVAVLDALAFLHGHGIMHRDVKPANILVNSAGVVKVCDLGVSGALINSLASTYVGTVTYMAPERIESSGDGGYTIKADVWSFGVTLAELALGRYPYPLAPYGEFPPPRDLSIWDALKLVVGGETPVTSFIAEGAPFSTAFVDFAAACLVKDPAARGSLDDLVNSPFITSARATPADVVAYLATHGPTSAATGDSTSRASDQAQAQAQAQTHADASDASTATSTGSTADRLAKPVVSIKPATTTLGAPPSLLVSSSDDEAYERPPLPPLPTHLFGFAVKKVLKRNLLQLVADKFSLYDASPPVVPPIPAAWSDDEPPTSYSSDNDDDDDDDGRGTSTAGGGSATGVATATGSGSGSDSDESEASSVSDGGPKPAWLANADLDSDSASETGDGPSGPSSNLPEYFADAGTELGLEVWRVIKGTPTRLSADEYGVFYKGDAYIVLGVEEVEYSKVYSLFFWIGDSVSLDQSLACSFAAQQLGRALGARAIRQDLGDESKKFRELFWFGMDLREGGTKAGLRKVVKKKVLSLYQIKGTRKPKVRKLPVGISSLNCDDVFLLDAHDVIYQWNGKSASMREKGKALDMITVIRSDERSGKVKSVILNHTGSPGSQLTSEELAFFRLVADAGADPPLSEASPDLDAGLPELASSDESDTDFEARVMASIKLSRVAESSSGKLSLDTVGEGELLRRSDLDPSAAFVLDSSTGIYAWVGKDSSDAQRAAAMQIAKLYHTQQERPPWQPVQRVVEGAESYLFKECFKGWHKAKARAKKHAMKAKLEARRRKASEARAKAKTIATPMSDLFNAVMERPAERVTDDPGGGKLTVMVLETDVLQYVLPHSMYGHFYTADVVLVIYYYQTEETPSEPASTKCVIYFWEGSAADKRVWLSFQHSSLKARLEESMQPQVIRVRESRESAHFRSLFNGQVVVHYGHLSWYVPIPAARLLPSDHPSFAKYAELEPDAEFNKDRLAPPTPHLWHVKGFGPDYIFVHEVPLKAAALDSNDAFVALSPQQGAFVWVGKAASDNEVAMAKFAAHEVVALANTHQLASLDDEEAKDAFVLSRIVVAREGSEPDEWWELFGGETAYVTLADPDFAPRLYTCGQGKNGFEISFVSNSGLTFDDLDSRSVLMLDAFSRLFVWMGARAPRGEPEMALKAAQEYVEAALDGRGGCPVTKVVEGEEPLEFTKQFLDWPHVVNGASGGNAGRPGLGDLGFGGGLRKTKFVDPRAEREARLEAEAKERAAKCAAALQASQCTIRATGFELLVVQEWRQCVTCGIEGDLVGVCASCAAVCHAGHTLSDAKTETFSAQAGASG